MNKNSRNSNRVPETGDRFKNGTSSKSRTSRGNFFNFIALVVCAAMFATVLAGCDEKEKDGNGDLAAPCPITSISGKLPDGLKYDRGWTKVGISFDNGQTLAKEVSISKDGDRSYSFTISDLPTPPASALESIDDFLKKLLIEEIQIPVTIGGDKTAKFVELALWIRNVNDDSIGEIGIETDGTNCDAKTGICTNTYVRYIYVSKDVSIQGKKTIDGFKVEINLNLKTGWNSVLSISIWSETEEEGSFSIVSGLPKPI